MRGRGAEDEPNARFAGRQRVGVNDTALLLSLRARVGEEEALAADDGSFNHQEAAAQAGIDRIDLFVEGLLVDSGAVDENANDMGMAQAQAAIGVGDRVGSTVRRSRALARSFLLRML